MDKIMPEPLDHEIELGSDTQGNPVPESAGAYLRSLSDKFRSHIPEEERRRIPPDFAKNHRYYRSPFRKEVLSRSHDK